MSAIARVRAMSVDWSIGIIPVQEWIAAARRSRDLFTGSRILSIFMGKCLQRLWDNGAEIWLPFFEGSDLEDGADLLGALLRRGGYSLTNRAVGTVPNKTLEEVEEVLQSLLCVVEGTWRDLREQALNGKAGKRLQAVLDGGEVDLAKTFEETACPVDLVWAAKEEDGSNQELPKRVEAIESIFSAVKRTRPVRPWNGRPVPKCVQCGRREALGPERMAEFRKFRMRVDGEREIQAGFVFGEGELLCPVCTIRRLLGYSDDQAFPSTSEMAASDWLYRIEQVKDLEALLMAWRDKAASIYAPGEASDPYPLLFPTSLRRARAKAAARKDKDLQEGLRGVEVRLAKLRQEIDRHNKHAPQGEGHVAAGPCDYLAVVTFDGDDMGKWVRKRISEAPGQLRDFSERLKKVLPGARGDGPARERSAGQEDGGQDRFLIAEPFYLGGDEGLVLCPLGQAIEVAASIREIWREEIGGDSDGPTLSAGIAIFHRERPLGAAIEDARVALEAAKDLRDKRGNRRKNGLAISVGTSSGSAWRAAAPWEDWDGLQSLIAAATVGELASGWSHDAEGLLRQTELAPHELTETVREALTSELRRITWRRTSRSGSREEIEQRAQRIWMRSGAGRWLSLDSEVPSSLSELADRLHLVGFAVRQMIEGGAREGQEESA